VIKGWIRRDGELDKKGCEWIRQDWDSLEGKQRRRRDKNR
jgi:hypothetical protein